MNDIFYVMLRRLRHPLITLIVIYSLATLGFVMIPGQDDQGNVWHMDFFHAIYFVSFMGSTIGFGEIFQPETRVAVVMLWPIDTVRAQCITGAHNVD